MKKIIYSLVALMAMSLTFVACEQPEQPQEPEQPQKPVVEPNCELRGAETSLTEYGQVYLFQFGTNDAQVTQSGFSGTGEIFQMQLYANPQEDLFPTEKTYKAYSAQEIEENKNFAEEEFVYGGAMIQQGNQVVIGGTLYASIENGKNQNIFLCVGGTVEFQGNAEDGTMIANLDFVNAKDGTASTKQYIYKGEFAIRNIKGSAPVRVIEYKK